MEVKVLGMLVMVCDPIVALLAPKAMLTIGSDQELLTSSQQLQIRQLQSRDAIT